MSRPPFVKRKINQNPGFHEFNLDNIRHKLEKKVNLGSTDGRTSIDNFSSSHPARAGLDVPAISLAGAFQGSLPSRKASLSLEGKPFFRKDVDKLSEAEAAQFLGILNTSRSKPMVLNLSAQLLDDEAEPAVLSMSNQLNQLLNDLSDSQNEFSPGLDDPGNPSNIDSTPEPFQENENSRSSQATTITLGSLIN